MTDSASVAIQTLSLSKEYRGVRALRSLDLEVPRQSIFGFLGPNGAGKSTTIKLLLGLSRPSAGVARVFGLDSRSSSIEIRRRIGYLPQETRFYEDLTARQTLRFTAGFFYSGPRAALDDRIQQTLTLVGLERRADRAIRGFSTGERQRLGIAQAQINQPELLILDEPAASLDPMGRHEVLQIMQRLRANGTTVFYSTHILSDVQRVSDFAAILNNGSVVAHGTIDELLRSSAEPSYTVELHGDAQPVLDRLERQSWITNVDVLGRNGTTRLKVQVADPALAEAQLMRLVTADRAATVETFSRDKADLEDVFLKLVQGGATHVQ